MATSPDTSLDLAVIVPVFNEQECIVSVLEEWRCAIGRFVQNFCIIVIDDGSTDQTPQKLSSLNWSELRIHRHANRGHGQSCLVGYQLAADAGASYVFQIDSDGQCDPQPFPELWQRRIEAPAVYGRRFKRDDGAARKLVTTVLRWLLKLGYRTALNDANVPYRLYPAKVAAQAAARVPGDFDLANIALALLLEPQGFIEVPIHFRDRSGGHPSVKWWGFGRKALKLIGDLRRLRNG